MNDPAVVHDLHAPILCFAARLVLAALPPCPARSARKSKLIRADRLGPVLAALTPLLLVTGRQESSTTDLHALLVLAHPDIYSLEYACTSCSIPLLNTWRLLATTRRVALPLACSSACIDLASALGHTPVLDWWLASPFTLQYSHMAVHMAVINVHPHVVQWWLANTTANSGPRAIELKAHFVPLLMHAIDYDLGAALHRWIDYGLPISRLDDCNTNRAVLHQSVFRKAWTVLDWWVRARSLGIVYPVADFDPHPYPVVNALECGEEGVFEWWVGPARLPVPEGLDDRILDAASAGGLPKVLEWWAANRGITRYSVVAMDLASFGTPIRWADRPESFYFWYPSISADRRIAVLDWWRNKSGVPLKYSSDLALTMFEHTGKMRTRVTGKPSVVEVLIPVLQWWLQSGLEVDWKTNARPERWDPQVREWWEREYLKLKGPAINADKKAAAETKKKSIQYSVSVAFARMTGGF